MTDFYNFQDYFQYQMTLKGDEKTTEEATKDEIIEIAHQLLINFQVTEFERMRMSGLADQFEAELNLARFNNPSPPEYAEACLTAEACLPPPPPDGPPSPSRSECIAETLCELKTAGIFGGTPVLNNMTKN
jgi:hypothetical protein